MQNNIFVRSAFTALITLSACSKVQSSGGNAGTGGGGGGGGASKPNPSKTEFKVDGLANELTIMPNETIAGACPAGATLTVTSKLLQVNPNPITCDAFARFAVNANFDKKVSGATDDVTFKVTTADGKSVEKTVRVYLDICSASANSGQFAGGSGTTESPYLICTPQQLNSVGNAVGKHFALARDLDLTGVAIASLNLRDSSFDGRGRTIRGFSQTPLPADSTAGLFRSLAGSLVMNLTFADFTVKGASFGTGGLVGGAASSFLSNIRVLRGSVQANSGFTIGALVGSACNTHFDRIFIDASVNVGTANSQVTAAGGVAGGCAAGNAYFIVSNSFSAATIVPDSASFMSAMVGGPLGGGSQQVFSNAVDAGTATATNSRRKGGLSGISYYGDAFGSYYLETNKGPMQTLGISRSLAQLKFPPNFAGFDTVKNWNLSVGSLPSPKVESRAELFIALKPAPGTGASFTENECFPIHAQIENFAGQAQTRTGDLEFRVSNNLVTVFAQQNACENNTAPLSILRLPAGAGPLTFFARTHEAATNGASVHLIPVADHFLTRALVVSSLEPEASVVTDPELTLSVSQNECSAVAGGTSCTYSYEVGGGGHITIANSVGAAMTVAECDNTCSGTFSHTSNSALTITVTASNGFMDREASVELTPLDAAPPTLSSGCNCALKGEFTECVIDGGSCADTSSPVILGLNGGVLQRECVNNSWTAESATLEGPGSYGITNGSNSTSITCGGDTYDSGSCVPADDYVRDSQGLCRKYYNCSNYKYHANVVPDSLCAQ